MFVGFFKMKILLRIVTFFYACYANLYIYSTTATITQGRISFQPHANSCLTDLTWWPWRLNDTHDTSPQQFSLNVQGDNWDPAI